MVLWSLWCTEHFLALVVMVLWSLWCTEVFLALVIMVLWSLWCFGHYGALVIMVLWSLWSTGHYGALVIMLLLNAVVRKMWKVRKGREGQEDWVLIGILSYLKVKYAAWKEGNGFKLLTLAVTII